MINGTVDDSGLDFIRVRIGFCRMACGPAAAGGFPDGRLHPACLRCARRRDLVAERPRRCIAAVVQRGAQAALEAPGAARSPRGVPAAHVAHRARDGRRAALGVPAAAGVLEGNRELRAFHGRAAIGILVVQDIVAVAILGAMGGGPTPWAFAILALPLLRPVLHRFLEWSGHGELLVLYGLMLALVLGGAAFEWMGLSPELGALLLGAMLAGHRRASELSGALWGLKEVFLVGFFLQIGMTGLPSWEGMQVALILAVVLPLKALLFFLILVLFRLRARSAFLAALSLATYSEFGLIVANLAVTRGWLTMDWLVILAVAVALSFVIAAPLNRYAHGLY